MPPKRNLHPTDEDLSQILPLLVSRQRTALAAREGNSSWRR